MRSAQSLLDELRAVDESASIEAKAGAAVDRSIMETVCAFANEPYLGGGHLLLGVAAAEEPGLDGRDYVVVGVPDPERLQADLVTQCASVFNRPVRPMVAVEQVEGRSVVVVFVPELAPAEKPLYLRSLGLPRGALRRVGPTDQRSGEDDLIALIQGHREETYDGSVIRDADLSDIDPDALRVYRQLRAEANPAAEELTWTDEELLRAVGAIRDDAGSLRPTVAGLLLFGKPMALRRCLPSTRIDYVRLPGREWMSDPDRRFDTVEIRAPLLVAVRRALAAVLDDLPKSFHLPEGSLTRREETVLPLRVIREAIVNAVTHRSYRVHGPMQILRYANRLEVRNPGGSLIAVDRLGEPGSRSRNTRIANVMHDLHLAENKGSGVRIMRELMKARGLMPPVFESQPGADQFVATFLFHHFLDQQDLDWLGALTTEPLTGDQMRALVFVREVGAIDNAVLRTLTGLDTLGASAVLRRLRAEDLLAMKGSGSRTYYVPGKRLTPSETPTPGETHELGADPHQLSADRHQVPADRHQLSADRHQVPADRHQLSADRHQVPADRHQLLVEQLPSDLRRRLPTSGARPRRAVVRALIRDLCAWRPLAGRDLAVLLGGRDTKVLLREHLRPMIAAGDLVHSIPQMPNHPDQKYTVPTPEEP